MKRTLAFALSAFIALSARSDAEPAAAMDEPLVGVSGVVDTPSALVALEDVVAATWIDEYRVLFARTNHQLAIRDLRTKETRTLALPAPPPRKDLPASWHWRISPDQRWAFVARSETASMSLKHGTPSELVAEALKLNWSGFVELSGSAVVPYEGFVVGWRGSKCLVALSQYSSPLLLVDPTDAAHAEWIFDDAGTLYAVSPDGRRAVAHYGTGGRSDFVLLDLVARTKKTLDVDKNYATRVAFSSDGRWLVTVNGENALARSIEDGTVVHSARLSKIGTRIEMTAVPGDVPRFVLLSEDTLVTLSIREKLEVVERAVPMSKRLLAPIAVSPTGGTIAWVADDGRVLLYEFAKRGDPIALSPKSDGAATFVAFDQPTWFYRSHFPPGGYSVYWPSDGLRSSPADELCRSADECLREGTALFTGRDGHRDARRAEQMLERACQLHNGEACFELARELERTSESKLARHWWLYKKGCLSGVDLACKALEQTAGQSISKSDVDPRARILEHIAMGCSGLCVLRADHSVTCLNGVAAPPGEFEALAAGSAHVCGVKTGGRVVCWGAGVGPVTNSKQSMEFGQSLPPPDRFKSITAGDGHTCGILIDGTAKCWGKNEFGQATPPRGKFSSVVAGNTHSCALRDDDESPIVCWGREDQGQTAVPKSGRYKQLDRGCQSACALDVDGGVKCWGLNGLALTEIAATRTD